MDKRQAQQKRILEVLFDFLKKDLKSISGEEKLAIINILLPFFIPPTNPDGSLGTDFTESYYRKKEIAPQSIDYVSTYQRLLSEGERLNVIQEKLRGFFNDLVQKKESFLRGIDKTIALLRVKNGVLEMAFVAFPLESKMNLTEVFANLILGNIFNLLVGLPVNSIKICNQCQGFFVNTSLRGKIYCSPSCAWRALAKKRREEIKKHPKKYRAYLKKQKEIMRRKYEEKRKAELGQNVKVHRRKED